MMVKVGIGTRSVFQKSSKFRSIFDSATTEFAFNPPQLVLRVLKSYISRIKEANGAAIIIHTEGSVDNQTDENLIELVDNVIKMDGEKITFVSSTHEAESNYKISSSGISVG